MLNDEIEELHERPDLQQPWAGDAIDLSAERPHSSLHDKGSRSWMIVGIGACALASASIAWLALLDGGAGEDAADQLVVASEGSAEPALEVTPQPARRAPILASGLAAAQSMGSMPRQSSAPPSSAEQASASPVEPPSTTAKAPSTTAKAPSTTAKAPSTHAQGEQTARSKQSSPKAPTSQVEEPGVKLAGLPDVEAWNEDDDAAVSGGEHPQESDGGTPADSQPAQFGGGGPAPIDQGASAVPDAVEEPELDVAPSSIAG